MNQAKSSLWSWLFCLDLFLNTLRPLFGSEDLDGIFSVEVASSAPDGRGGDEVPILEGQWE